MHTGKVLLLTKIHSGNMDCTLALDETDHLCNGVFRWDRYQYVNMIRLKVPFQYPALFLSCKTVQQVGKILPDSSEKHLAATFGDPYNMILAIPFRVT